MTLAIKVKERGATPRHLRKVHTQAGTTAWASTGWYFHSDMRDDRFTKEHARTARYQKRTEKYTERKRRQFGHTRPLEFSGDVRRRVKTAKISSSGNGANVRYSGARKLNFRRWHSSPKMALEFRRITADEKRKLAAHYDDKLDTELNADQTQSTETI